MGNFLWVNQLINHRKNAAVQSATRLGEAAALQQVKDLVARGRLAVQRVVVLWRRSGVEEEKWGENLGEKHSDDFFGVESGKMWQNVVPVPN